MVRTERWPVLTQYAGDRLVRVALPLGGIGTGTVSLGGRGQLRDWEIMNRPAKGFAPERSFFALHVRGPRGAAVTRALEGVLHPECYEGARGAVGANHGWPRFRQCRFLAAYPLGQVCLSDPDVPVDVRIEAFNPLIPGDAESSGIPVAILRFALTNRTSAKLTATVCGSVDNFIGFDGKEGKPLRNRNRFRPAGRDGAPAGILMQSEGVCADAPQFGTIALATTARDVTWRTAWAKATWGDSLLDFHDDLHDDGRLDERKAEGVDAPIASLAATVSLPPRATREVLFLLAWHFPNRVTWSPRKPKQSACGCGSGCGEPAEIIGNYYASHYADAWEVIARTAPHLPQLERKTLAFVNSFLASDLPNVVKESALYNLSTLRSQTCFRTPDGHFFGWEGCGNDTGCCMGSCTHVWNYEQATGFLFGNLARSMREVEFLHATAANGLMSFRTTLPLARALDHGIAAADGQMGCLMRLYREWQLSGDRTWLRRLWPKARAAMEFCWIPSGWDADQDGVMEGCQHNTMDVEYYGPNPQMGTWYLGALRACEEMAQTVGDAEFAQRCRGLFEQGSRWMDAHLFNGAYYEQEIRPTTIEAIAPGLRHNMGANDPREPILQLGPGCLVDQLVGQQAAQLLGLGYLLDPQHVRMTLRSIMKHNFRSPLYRHFNHLRTFALNDESALLMASYPRGHRPKRPFPYYNEVMTGFEYAAAVHMLQEGQTSNGLKCIAAIRARYDGARRNPFDEAECGHHYARAMASWGAVLALTGFHYSAVEGELRFDASPRPAEWFWSNGSAWGTFRQRPGPRKIVVELKVLHGTLAIRRLSLSGAGTVERRSARRIKAGQSLRLSVGLR